MKTAGFIGLALALHTALPAATPKLAITHTTAKECAQINAFVFGSCRGPGVSIRIYSADSDDRFLIGLRFLDSEGMEVIESRYPVKTGTTWFYFGNGYADIELLSATGASMKTNEVVAWYAKEDKGK